MLAEHHFWTTTTSSSYVEVARGFRRDEHIYKRWYNLEKGRGHIYQNTTTWLTVFSEIIDIYLVERNKIIPSQAPMHFICYDTPKRPSMHAI